MIGGVSIGEALRRAQRHLHARSPSARRDAEILLGSVLMKPRASLFANATAAMPAAALAQFEGLVAARAAGTPVAYLLGEREFWSLRLVVSPDVLIPRPETERLLELALAATAAQPRGAALDLGTGSGAIALAFATERAQWRVRGVDISDPATRLAERNRARLNLANVRFTTGDWYQTLPEGGFDLILANPPYVASHDPLLAHGDLRAEPRLALDGGPDGLTALRAVIAGAPRHLRSGGRILVEHGATQGAAARALCAAAYLADVDTVRDYAGLERVTTARWRA